MLIIRAKKGLGRTNEKFPWNDLIILERYKFLIVRWLVMLCQYIQGQTKYTRNRRAVYVTFTRKSCKSVKSFVSWLYSQYKSRWSNNLCGHLKKIKTKIRNVLCTNYKLNPRNNNPTRMGIFFPVARKLIISNVGCCLSKDMRRVMYDVSDNKLVRLFIENNPAISCLRLHLTTTYKWGGYCDVTQASPITRKETT